MAARVLLLGTGTDVGKTHVACALLREARARGLRARAYKPIATGVSARCEDAERHARALEAPYVAPTFAYAPPVSPHLAAREAGRPIELARVRAAADALASGADALVVEGAGGLFTPLGPGLTNADLVRAVAADVVLLVAPDRLGVLHDVGAARAAALARGLVAPLLVLSAPAAPDTTTGTNAAELDLLGLGPVASRFPRASLDDGDTRSAAARVWDAIGLRARR